MHLPDAGYLFEKLSAHQTGQTRRVRELDRYALRDVARVKSTYGVSADHPKSVHP